MPIYYPLQMPSNKGIMRAAFRARSVVGMSRSPFSGSQQVYQWPGEWWEAECTLPQMLRPDAEQWAAFLASLRGPSGTFLLGDPAAKTPLGSALTINGGATAGFGNVAGTELVTRSWQVSTNGLLLAGDYVQVPQNQLTAGYSLADASWIANNLTVTTGVTDPSGGTGAVTLTPSASGASYQNKSAGINGNGVVSGNTWFFSVWLKASAAFTNFAIGIQDQLFNTFVHAQFSLTTSWAQYLVTGVAAATSTSVWPTIGSFPMTWTTGNPSVSAWGATLYSSVAGSRLYKAMQSLNSDGAGNATIEIFPRLREVPLPFSPIITSSPVGQFRLADSSVEWDEDKAKIYSLGFKAIEAI